MLALLLSLLISPAHADPYWVAGIGKAQLNQVDTNGHWVQEGYDHRIDQTSNTFRVGAGWDFGLLSAELDYRDLGEFNSMIRFVSDKNYTGRGCRKPCEVPRTAWLSGETQGIAASVIASPDWPIAPLVRAGVMFHWSKFTANYAYGDGILSFSREGKGLDAPPFNDSGINYLFGLGVRMDNVDFEATYYPKVASGGSAYHDAYSFTLSVRF